MVSGGEISKMHDTNEEIEYHHSLLKNLTNMRDMISSRPESDAELSWINARIEEHEEKVRELEGKK